MNSLKIMKTICILLLSSQSILCNYISSFAASKRVNTKLGLGLNLGIDEQLAFLVGFIERNSESYFNNPFQNVFTINGYLVGDARCTETFSGCGVCDIYAPRGSKANALRYRLCQWGYNINWPFQYNGNGGWGRNGLSNQPIGGGSLINDISAFQGNTDYNVVRWMWGKYPSGGFNIQGLPINPKTGCTDDYFTDNGAWRCMNTYIMNSQANAMNFMKYVQGVTNITPAEIQANFP